MDNNRQGGKQFVRCREVVHSSECPLSEVPLYYEVRVCKLLCLCTSCVPQRSRRRDCGVPVG